MKDIIIQPTEIAINKDRYGYYIWASLFDIKAYSKERLEYITSLLDYYNLFSFSNTGTYAGIHPKDHIPFTFDDATASVTWLERLLGILAEKSSKNVDAGERLLFKINKTELLHNDISDIHSVLPKYTDDIAKNIINAYVIGIAKIINREKGITDFSKLILDGEFKKIIGAKSKYSVAVRDRIYIT